MLRHNSGGNVVSFKSLVPKSSLSCEINKVTVQAGTGAGGGCILEYAGANEGTALFKINTVTIESGTNLSAQASSKTKKEKMKRYSYY